MKYLFLEYPKCGTCRKAKNWLEEHGINYKDRHIVTENPTVEELSAWIAKSGLPIKRFFNTSGMLYKDLKLKDELPIMTDDEQIQTLSSNGMLVKRPIVVGEDIVLVGFKPKEWEKLID